MLLCEELGRREERVVLGQRLPLPVGPIWMALKNPTSADCALVSCLESTLEWEDGSPFSLAAFRNLSFSSAAVTGADGDRIALTVTSYGILQIESFGPATTEKGVLCMAEREKCILRR